MFFYPGKTLFKLDQSDLDRHLEAQKVKYNHLVDVLSPLSLWLLSHWGFLWSLCKKLQPFSPCLFPALFPPYHSTYSFIWQILGSSHQRVSLVRVGIFVCFLLLNLWLPEQKHLAFGCLSLLNGWINLRFMLCLQKTVINYKRQGSENDPIWEVWNRGF